MKRLLISLLLVLTMTAGLLVSCGNDDGENIPEDSAAAVFTIDVNPGVRVFVDAEGKVISLEATNDDGGKILAELKLTGETYEVAVEEIIDKFNEKGYLKDEVSSVLISIEKKALDISAKLEEKVNGAFEKHGKHASVIEQEIDDLDDKVRGDIEKIANKHHISKGKAHLIERIREEFPELSEQELAELSISDLRILLEEVSDEVKGHFNKIGSAIKDAYLEKEAAINAALESLEIDPEKITHLRAHISREDGKMIFDVKFVYDGLEYEFEIDAVSGEVLSVESEEFVEPDFDEIVGDFINKHKDKFDGDFDFEGDFDSIKDKVFDKIFGEGADDLREKILSKGEIIDKAISELDIEGVRLADVEIKLIDSESGPLFSVEIETRAGDEYELVIEAYSGIVIRAELNGSELELAPAV
jgi:uncharacterized membrane protein YkoI